MALTTNPVFEKTIVHDAITTNGAAYSPGDNSALCRAVFFKVEAIDPASSITAVSINGTPVVFSPGDRIVRGDGESSASFSISVTATGRVRLVVWARYQKGHYNPAEMSRPPTHPVGT